MLRVIIAHAIVLIANYFGCSISPDGYTFPYIWLVSFGSALYALIGLLITYKMIKIYYDQKIAIISVISIWLASPLVFYMYSHPMMAHANDMFAYALILFIWQRTRQRHNIRDYILLGASAGLAALIRNQNAALAILILLFVIADVIYKKTTWHQGLMASIIFSLAWWVTFFPQLIVWHETFGKWFPGSPYASCGLHFHLGFPWLLHVLFSDNRGLFIWHPLLLLGVIGWRFLWIKDHNITIFILVSFLFQLGIVSSYDGWDGASAFGQRFFVNLAPAFMFGFAALLSEMKEKTSFKIMISLCTVFIVWNFILIIQYAMGTVPRGCPTDLWLLVKNQFMVIPNNFGRIINAWHRKS